MLRVGVTLGLALISTGLVGCESQTQESALHALTVFCRLHQAEIFHVLLTPEQVTAGHTVCRAVGLPLGNDSI